MAFFCPIRVRKAKKKKDDDMLDGRAPAPGRITGSASIETLVRVGLEKESSGFNSSDNKMIVLHDFTPCVDDELEVKRGQIVIMLYQENDWVYVISVLDNSEGFIPFSYCTPLSSALAQIVDHKNKIPRHGVGGGGGSALGTNNGHVGSGVNGGYCHENTGSAVGTAVSVLTNTTCVTNNAIQGTSNDHNSNIGRGTTIATVHPMPDTDNRMDTVDAKMYIIDNQGNDMNKMFVNFPPEENNKVMQMKHNKGNHCIERNDIIMEYNNCREEPLVPQDIHPFCKDILGQFIVLYTFVARDENDLSVNSGEHVTVLNRDDPDWYWILRSDGKEGFVPAAFLCNPEVALLGKKAVRMQQNHHHHPIQETTNEELSQSHQHHAHHLHNNNRNSNHQSKNNNNINANNQLIQQNKYLSQQKASQHHHQSHQQQQHSMPLTTNGITNQTSLLKTTMGSCSKTGNNNGLVSGPTSANIYYNLIPMTNLVNNNNNNNSHLKPPPPPSQAMEESPTNSTLSTIPSGAGTTVSTVASCDSGISTRGAGTELIMLYAYKAQAPDELTVQKGDWIFADLTNQSVQGWLWAHDPKTRKFGFIPKAYARRMASID